MAALADPEFDLVAFEKEKIKGAIRTDFILSAEIVVIALGTVQDTEFMTRVMVVSAIAALMTVGVYGLVAMIVKLDDAGLFLLKTEGQMALGRFKQKLGRGMLLLAPKLMKGLSVVGTLAMFLVGGGILSHGVHQVQDWISGVGEGLQTFPYLGGFLAGTTEMLMSGAFGFAAGSLIVALYWCFQKISKRLASGS
jgi:predicted DNA repair protein MutK